MKAVERKNLLWVVLSTAMAVELATPQIYTVQSTAEEVENCEGTGECNTGWNVPLSDIGLAPLQIATRQRICSKSSQIYCTPLSQQPINAEIDGSWLVELNSDYHGRGQSEQIPGAGNTQLANLSMNLALAYLSPGNTDGGKEVAAIREAHWHAEGDEWGLILQGTCLITVQEPLTGKIDRQTSKAGEAWYFPANWVHSIQASGTEGCFFVLGFNSGVGLKRQTTHLSNGFNYFAQGKQGAQELAAEMGITTAEAERVRLNLLETQHERNNPGWNQLAFFLGENTWPGDVKELQQEIIFDMFNKGREKEILNGKGSTVAADTDNWAFSSTMSAESVHLPVGGRRNDHWHDCSEIAYVYQGLVDFSVVNLYEPQTNGKRYRLPLNTGDVAYAPKGSTHSYLCSKDSPTDCHVLIMWDCGKVGTWDNVQSVRRFPKDQICSNLQLDKTADDKELCEKIYNQNASPAFGCMPQDYSKSAYAKCKGQELK